MTAPPCVQTIIAHHLRALAGQDDSTLAQQQRDAAIRTLLEADKCPRCEGFGRLASGRVAIGASVLSNPTCPDCAGTGKPPRASTIAQLVTDASPTDRGLSRQRVDQIVKGRR
jgi:DnaJ-class molecular chaperone